MKYANSHTALLNLVRFLWYYMLNFHMEVVRSSPMPTDPDSEWKSRPVDLKTDYVFY